MKLDALGRQLAVAHAHHYSAAARALLEAARQLRLEHERVIAPHPERRGQAAKDRAAVVLDRGGLAVDRLPPGAPAPPPPPQRPGGPGHPPPPGPPPLAAAA